jgi:PTH1 family peptidyl-tRNA hydrolase
MRIGREARAAKARCLRSVSAYCGNDYQRVRVGVGRPEDKNLVEAYVLMNFEKDERPWVEAAIEAITDAVECIVTRRPEEFQNRVHLALAAKGFRPAQPDTPPA